MIRNLITISKQSSLARAGLFTSGHFLVDTVVISTITGAPIELAGLAAFVGPIINGCWFYILDRWWSEKHERDPTQHSSAV